jgi:hypothetical protein
VPAFLRKAAGGRQGIDARGGGIDDATAMDFVLTGMDFVHDGPDRARAAPASGAAAQATVNLAGAADGVLGSDGSDLMVRNDIARTHDHDRTPPHCCERGISPRAISLANLRPGECHLLMQRGKNYEMKSL